MKNRKQLFKTSRLLLLIVAVALVLSMGLTACGFLTDATKGVTPDDVIINAGSIENNGAKGEADQNSQNFSSNAKVNLSETYGDLLPLYETLTEQEGSAYSIVIHIAGGVNVPDISGAVDWRLVITVSDEETIGMELLDENDRVLFVYKDGKINLDGFGMDVGYYQDIINADISKLFDGEDATVSIGKIMAYLNGFLVDYDSLAQIVPVLFNSMNLNTTGLVMSSQDGEYVFNANCQSLLALLTTYFSDSFDDLIAGLPFEIDIAQLLGVENTEASDLELVIAAVDDMFFDGALLNGYVDLNAHLTVTENGFDSSVALVNAFDHEQAFLYLGFGGAIEEEIPIDIPEVTALHDIQADIPISLPQSGLEMTIHAIIHTADIFAEEGKDFITATVDLNGIDDAIQFVVNSGYFYVDINSLVEIAFPMLGETTDYTYMLPFKEGNRICSLFEEMFNDFVEFDVNYDRDCFYPGMTEESLREILYVAIIYCGRIPRELFDYEIKGFCKCPYDGNYWYEICYNGHCCWEVSWGGDNVNFISDAPIFDEHLSVDFDSCRGVYPGITEAGLREIMHVRFENVEIDDYVITNFYTCPYCGTVFVEISYMGYCIRSSIALCCYEEFSHIGETFESPAEVPHWKPYYNPDKKLGLCFDYSSVNFYEGMSSEEVRENLHVYILYRGRLPEEIFDYEISEFWVAGNEGYLEVYFYRPEFQDIWPYGITYSSDRIVSDDDFNLSLILPFMSEIDTNNPLEVLAGIVGGVVGIYLENQDILGNAIQVEDIENGKNIVICLSDSLVEDGDLLAFVNTFLGLPVGDGFADINGQTLYYFLTETLDADTFAEIDGALQMVGGFTLEDLCTDLYLNLTGYLNNNNKLRFGLSLTGADTDPEFDESYLTIGIIEYHAVVTDSAYDAALTAEDLAAAHPFDEIVDVLFGCFASLFGGDLE